MKHLILIIFLFPSFAFAQAIKTNINGVVIKKPYCFKNGDMKLTVSNRSSNILNAILIVTAFDQDKDPVGNGKKRIKLGPISGDDYYIDINCDQQSTFAYRFE